MTDERIEAAARTFFDRDSMTWAECVQILRDLVAEAQMGACWDCSTTVAEGCETCGGTGRIPLKLVGALWATEGDGVRARWQMTTAELRAAAIEKFGAKEET